MNSTKITIESHEIVFKTYEYSMPSKTFPIITIGKYSLVYFHKFVRACCCCEKKRKIHFALLKKVVTTHQQTIPNEFDLRTDDSGNIMISTPDKAVSIKFQSLYDQKRMVRENSKDDVRENSSVTLEKTQV